MLRSEALFEAAEHGREIGLEAHGGHGLDYRNVGPIVAIPEIEECHHITGAADYILKIRARDMNHMGAIVRGVQTTQHVFSTETDIVFSTGFEGRAIPLVRTEATEAETGRRGSTYR